MVCNRELATISERPASSTLGPVPYKLKSTKKQRKAKNFVKVGSYEERLGRELLIYIATACICLITNSFENDRYIFFIAGLSRILAQKT